MVLHMMDMLHLVGAVEQGVLAHAVSMVLTVTDGQQVHHPVVTEALEQVVHQFWLEMVVQVVQEVHQAVEVVAAELCI